jgi:UDP-N-acetylmuramoyl-L-alanyl-D-glutamate--2,6-diaminopimelate ligase
MIAAAQQRHGPLLSELLDGIVQVPASLDRQISSLALDSRSLQSGGLFLACQGASSHGLNFVEQALEQGVAAIAWEPDGADIDVKAGSLQERLDLPLLPFYANPSRHMRVVGITGTNGKTSVSHLLAQALHPDKPCGIVGTLGVGYVKSLAATGYTTPDAVSLQAVLADLKNKGAKAVAMEVSISRDHFDYHGNMENYAAAKQRLFHMPGLRSAVINLDDPMGAELLATLAAGVDVLVYSLNPDQALPQGVAGWVRAESVLPKASGLEITLSSHWGEGVLHSSLLGRFNAANLLAVLLVLLDQGVDLPDALERLAEVTTVAGRMEAYGGSDRPTVVIDYAHTPDALEKALQALRGHCSGELMVVFGCGGDRDRGKRPQMGGAAERLADRVIVTDDNPRTEPGDRIVDEILTGMTRRDQVKVERHRAKAIQQAVAAAMPGDLVLVAGKGHEDYQQVGTQKLPFSDQQQVLSALAAWKGGNR